MLPFVSDDRVFDLVNVVALLGWLALLISPLAPRICQILANFGAVSVLAAVYVVLFAATVAADPAGGAELDFRSLDGIMAMLGTREGALIGWTHFLAFDLFVGAWEARTGRREGIAFWFIVPCLLLTFFAGPLGLLLFFCVCAVKRLRAKTG